MATRRSDSRWDDPWQKFGPSKPLAVEGGMATSRARGAMAETWWSKRFVAVLESYGLGGRMTRGRTYARKGQVLSLDVSAGLLVAQVQGSRRVPYAVTVRIAVPTNTQWVKIDDALRSRVGFAARLMAGEVPADLEAVFTDVGCRLFPLHWDDLRCTCSCPDWGDPCKHQAAVLYVFADRLESDPWLLLAWLGRSRDDVLGLFATGAATAMPADSEIAPWWPLRPGTDGPLRTDPGIVLPDDPSAVLGRLGVLDADAVGRPITELLLRAYWPEAVRPPSPPG